MLFHAARFEARTDLHGRLLLLEDQDRTKWDQSLIDHARWFLDRSAEGEAITTFHLEAGIALLHSSAASFAETNWSEILRLYDALVQKRPSAVYLLNRAIVLAHLEGPAAGIRALESLSGDSSLRNYHLFYAVLGELHRRAGDLSRARQHLEARTATQSVSDRELLDRRIAACKSDHGGDERSP